MDHNYVELHCHSNFSLLDGASHPEELVAQAAELGMSALALTDHDAVYGAPRFTRAANEHGIRPILGAELTLKLNSNSAKHAKAKDSLSMLNVKLSDSSARHLTLLVENEAGWHNLCYLISRARHAMPKGEAMLPVEELVGCTNGLIALSGCRHGEIAAALLKGDRGGALAAARHYRELFGADNFWIELQRHHLPGDERLVPKMAALASYLQLGCVVTNNVHYAVQSRHRLQDVLVCIRHLTTLDAATHLRRPNSEYYLKPAEQMAALFPDHQEALSNTWRLAERCNFELKYGLQDLPPFPAPHGMSSSAYLRRLCEEALPMRYPDALGPDALEPDVLRPDTLGPNAIGRVRQQLIHELDVIERAGLANYFLIVWDIVHFARREGIRCQGRGSAANSLVAYLLHISPIDPLAHDLVFERFLSAESVPNSAIVPDIDIDFDAQRREEVIQYIYEKYGPEHTAMACTFVTFRSRSALRDIGKALDLPPNVVAAAAETAAAQALDSHSSSTEFAGQNGSDARGSNLKDSIMSGSSMSGSSTSHSYMSLLLDLCEQIDGFPRHLGIHSGGMIITGPPLMGRVPTEPATMPDRVVVQWDKDGLEDAGLIKIDILGLRMLSAITETVAFLEESQAMPHSPDMPHGLAMEHSLEFQTRESQAFSDPAVYDMISQADTVGAFQVESRAQAQMLPRLRPRCFNDLVVAISLIRPGPIQGNMVHPFLNRRLGLEPVSYAHPSLEPALAETLGVILFQEQVLKVARDLAGFTPGQGEQLRRALGSKRAVEEIERLRADFLAGAKAQGVPVDVAETVFDQLRAFGGYSFAKSHAAAFAVLVYQSAWLKRYYFAPFFASLLNNQPMGFWNPAVLVNEAKRQGIEVLPVDIHISQPRCVPLSNDETGFGQAGDRAAGHGIRLGLNYIKALREEHIDRIMTERENRPFTGLADLYRRVRPGRRAAENIIMSGALDSWGIPRRQLLWELGTLPHKGGGPEALDLVFQPDVVDLLALTPAEAMLGEQEVLGLSTGDQIMSFYRARLIERGILDSVQVVSCANGQRVLVAGLVVVHQSPPTAKGFHFITLEDEVGMMNIIVRPQVYTRYRRTLRESRLLLIEGIVQQEGVGLVGKLSGSSINGSFMSLDQSRTGAQAELAQPVTSILANRAAALQDIQDLVS